MKSLKSDIAVPLYLQLHDTIREQIKAGEFKPGHQIPSEDKLSEMYSVSRVTVRSALLRLVQEGVLVKRHGKGTFVAMPVFVESMSAGGSFTKSCLQRGAVPATRLLSCNIQSAAAPEARRLGVCEGESIICARRIRLVDDVATILEIDYFRGSFNFLIGSDMSGTPLSELIARHTGIMPRSFEDIYDVVRAGREHASSLGCNLGTPLLRVWQTVMAEQRQVLYCNEQYIMSDLYKYAITYGAN